MTSRWLCPETTSLPRATASCGRARGQRLSPQLPAARVVGSRNPPTWHIPPLTVVRSETSHTQHRGWHGSLVLKSLPPKTHRVATSEVPYRTPCRPATHSLRVTLLSLWAVRPAQASSPLSSTKTPRTGFFGTCRRDSRLRKVGRSAGGNRKEV